MTTVPVRLSATVMNLLAKTGEERYQTAAGLEADLRRCLTAWETSRQIDAFPLGEQDVSERLLIPERLYGRERQIDALLVAFDRVAASGSRRLRRQRPDCVERPAANVCAIGIGSRPRVTARQRYRGFNIGLCIRELSHPALDPRQTSFGSAS